MDELFQRMSAWMGLKMSLNKRGWVRHCKEREIWWVHLGANVGDEEDGKHGDFERPAVVVCRFFGGKVIWIVPLTTSAQESDYYFKTSYANARGETVAQYAIIPHLRAVSQKRLIRKLRTLPKDEFGELVTRIAAFLP